MAAYRLVHSALLWVEDGVTRDLGDEAGVSQGDVVDEKKIPAGALKRGLETGALEKVSGKAAAAASEPTPAPTEGEPEPFRKPRTHADADEMASEMGVELPEDATVAVKADLLAQAHAEDTAEE